MESVKLFPPVSSGAIEVLRERERQRIQEHWTDEHDDQHTNGELAYAAACYILAFVPGKIALKFIAKRWPWDKSWWKPTSRRRNLVKAAALLLAEIDRIDRDKRITITGTTTITDISTSHNPEPLIIPEGLD